MTGRLRAGACIVVLGLSLGCGVARAQDSGAILEETAPIVVSPGAGVPADGAILIRGTGNNRPTVTVRNAARVDLVGTLSVLSTDAVEAYYAWSPAEPFEIGRYLVTLQNRELGLESNAYVGVASSSAHEPPAITASASVTGMIATVETCCTDPLGEQVPVCGSGANHLSLLLDPGLASSEPLATLNQFLFRARAAEDSGEHVASDAWKPLGLTEPVQFLEQAGEYCAVIEALDIATRHEHVYANIEVCARRGELEPGTSPVALPPALLAQDACLHPPEGHDAEWCDANQDVCDIEMKATKCELYRYTCEGGLLPQPWRDILAHEPAVQVAPGEPSGCSVVSARPSRCGGRAAWLAGWLVIYAAHRARSKHWPHNALPGRTLTRTGGARWVEVRCFMGSRSGWASRAGRTRRRRQA